MLIKGFYSHIRNSVDNGIGCNRVILIEMDLGVITNSGSIGEVLV